MTTGLGNWETLSTVPLSGDFFVNELLEPLEMLFFFCFSIFLAENFGGCFDTCSVSLILSCSSSEEEFDPSLFLILK